MFYARQETILEAIKTVRKASFGPPPRVGKLGFIHRSEWVDSCAKITGTLNDVLRDVQHGDLAPLVARSKAMKHYYHSKPE